MFSAGQWTGFVDRGLCDTPNQQKVEKKKEPPTTHLKTVVVGHYGAGKTSLTNMLVKRSYRFTEKYTPTGGTDFVGTCVINDKHKLTFFDTVGQEEHDAVTDIYIRGAALCVVVYDITSRESVESVPKWVERIERLCSHKPLLVLIGAKNDLDASRVVSKDEEEFTAVTLGFDLYGECSAKTNTGITEIFEEVAVQFRRKYKATAGETIGTGGTAGHSPSQLGFTLSVATPEPTLPQLDQCCIIG